MMDPAILNELFSPWWRPIVAIATTVFIVVVGIIAVRFTVKFDLNVWLRDRRDAKALKERKKRVDGCGHVWTLYRFSQFSQCNFCLAYIATSSLVVFYDSPAVSIAGEDWDLLLNPPAGSIIVANPIGTRHK